MTTAITLVNPAQAHQAIVNLWTQAIKPRVQQGHRLTLKVAEERLDLALLVSRLIRRMRAARTGEGIVAGDDALEQQCIGYLRRKGLTSPLREEGPNARLTG